MVTGLPVILESTNSSSYGPFQDKLRNRSFLGSFRRCEAQMISQVQKLVDQSNELIKNEIEMINALRNLWLVSVQQLIYSLKTQIANIQDIRYRKIKKTMKSMQNLFYTAQSNETELQEFATELQYFVNEINIQLECISARKPDRKSWTTLVKSTSQ